MKPSKLNIIRWILLILSLFFLFLTIFVIDKGNLIEASNSFVILVYIFSLFSWFLCTVSLLALFIVKRKTISKSLRVFLISLAIISFVLYLVFRLIPGLSDYELLPAMLIFTIIYSIVLAFVCFLEKIEIILLGLIVVIITGFIINRFGLFEGVFLIPFAFFLSSIGFLILFFRSIFQYKMDKTKGIIFILFFLIMAILNALLFIKFLDSNPALNNIYDIIGVVIFLLASLALFIYLPFSNFTDWPKTQKVSFRRLIIAPLILFLFIFSLKFLLPDNIYRNIFFIEYSQKEKPHFNMKDYTIDFSKK